MMACLKFYRIFPPHLPLYLVHPHGYCPATEWDLLCWAHLSCFGLGSGFYLSLCLSG